MKLLVAGDSFAEFSGYRNHFTQMGIAPHKGANHDATFSHWCELLAQDLNMTAVSHAIGGAGISSSSYVATQQILTEQYAGVVFFVSHHCRSIVNSTLSLNDWKKHVKSYCVPERGIDIYNKDLYKHYQYHYHRKNALQEPPVIKHVNAEDIMFNDGAVKLSIGEQSYITQKAGYSYIHDGVTAVLALKALCDAKNIPIVFASCFAEGVCEVINDMGYNLKHFEFYNVEHKHNFSVLHDYPSHYNDQQHSIMFSEFKKQYPEYIQLFQNSGQPLT